MRLRHRNLRFRLDVEVAKDEGFEEARRTYGLRRADRSRFPYEPRVVGGKLMSPVELQRLRRFILDTAVIEAISDEMRAVVEAVWPELVHKLPLKKLHG